ncbi:GSCOCG00003675001-RA-CDS [Cotesia congregata]|nr:GSCOCG00003675001-RA-CDS [Cotesia congregata]
MGPKKHKKHKRERHEGTWTKYKNGVASTFVHFGKFITTELLLYKNIHLSVIYNLRS